MNLLRPAAREDFAFLGRRALALAPLWLLAAALSWVLRDDQCHNWVVWGNLGIIVGLLTRRRPDRAEER